MHGFCKKIVYFRRELVDGYIESSEDPKRQLMILTMIARHYTEKEAMEMLPGLTSYRYQKASERDAFLCNPFDSNFGTGICDKI